MCRRCEREATQNNNLTAGIYSGMTEQKERQQSGGKLFSSALYSLTWRYLKIPLKQREHTQCENVLWSYRFTCENNKMTAEELFFQHPWSLSADWTIDLKRQM